MGRLIPYVVVWTAWWVLAMFATLVRIGAGPWRPVFDLFFAQALLFEAILPHLSAGVTRVIWLLLYVLLAVVAWLLIEHRRRRHGSDHCWRRACLSSVALQVMFVALGYVVGE